MMNCSPAIFFYFWSLIKSSIREKKKHCYLSHSFIFKACQDQFELPCFGFVVMLSMSVGHVMASWSLGKSAISNKNTTQNL